MSQISSTSVSLNAVPSSCQAYLDRRMALGETEQTIRDEMERIIAGKHASWEIDRLHRKTWTGEELTYEPLHLAWQISLEHPLAKAFIAAYAETFGKQPEKYDFWDFSTNAVALIRLGIPTIGFGPGEHKLAHMRDERCAVRQIVEACEVYSEGDWEVVGEFFRASLRALSADFADFRRLFLYTTITIYFQNRAQRILGEDHPRMGNE